MLGYTIRQLLRYHAYCVANPDGRVLPPGGQRGWDDMTAAEWLRWFRACLMKKITRAEPVGRKHDPDWQRQVYLLADRVNSPRLVVRRSEVMPEFRDRLARRITQPWEE